MTLGVDKGGRREERRLRWERGRKGVVSMFVFLSYSPVNRSCCGGREQTSSWVRVFLLVKANLPLPYVKTDLTLSSGEPGV